MKSIRVNIFDHPFKLKIKKNRNDAGVLTLGVTLRSVYKLPKNHISFHYFTNGRVSVFNIIDQNEYRRGEKRNISLRDAKLITIKYFVEEFLHNVNNYRTK